jgi:hypothetical protein
MRSFFLLVSFSITLLLVKWPAFSNASEKQAVIRHDSFFSGSFSIVFHPYQITGEVASTGNETFQSIFLNYQIGSEPVQTTFFENINLNPYLPFRYQASEPWLPEITGQFELKVWFTGLNGAPEEQGFSDTLRRAISIYEYLPKRQLALLESFSSINCGSCAIVSPVLRQMIEKNPELYAMIYYHPLAYEGSPLYLFNPHDQTARKELYDITYTPVSAIGTTYFGGSFEVTPELLDIEGSKFSPFNIQGSYHINENMLHAELELEAFVASAETNFSLLVAVIENEVHFESAPGSNGEKEFFYVMRSFLPNANGTMLSGFEMGNIIEHAFDYNMSELAIDQEKISVLAFIQDLESLEILQVARLSFQPLDPTAITKPLLDQFNAYPNPTKGLLNVSFQNTEHPAIINIYTLSGNLIKQVSASQVLEQIQLDLGHLPEGIYFLQAIAGNKTFTKKISVIKP